jgi:hypothetical protein
MIVKSFKNFAVQRGGLFFFHPEKAIEIIEILQTSKVQILGLDAFKITETQTQPVMEHSIDLSFSKNSWNEARDFLNNRKTLGLLFEIVANEK